jgi:hypothetical protein
MASRSHRRLVFPLVLLAAWPNRSHAQDTPDSLCREIVARPQTHPDLHGVPSGKGGPACRVG